MHQAHRAKRGQTSIPPAGYEVIRSQGRYFPVSLHLEDRQRPGATAFHHPDGSVVSFARRLPAVLYLYQHSAQGHLEEGNASYAP
jgi:hypothetical protein